MKKLLLMCALFISIGCTAQELNGIRFETGDFASLLTKAKEQDRLIFIDIYAEWCGPCQFMAANIFTQQEVGNYFNPRFINAKFDAEKGEGIMLARRYGVTGYPTFLLIDSNGILKGKLVGGSPAEDFIRKINKLVEAIDNQ